MPSNLLALVPLLAGYLFYRIFYYTRFRGQSLDGYRLIFHSSIVGLAFFVGSHILISILKLTACGQHLWEWWGRYASHTEHSGATAGTVLLAVSSAVMLNIPIWETWIRAFRRKQLRAKIRSRLRRYLNPFNRTSLQLVYTHVAFWDADAWAELLAIWEMKRRMALNWATKRQKNQLLVLLNEATQKRRMISVTLKNRKIYVGYVKSAPSLDPCEIYFRVYPVFSGYRDKDNLRFERTTDYE
jgi:hypothetical protein